MDMTGPEAIRQGIYGAWLAERARELEAEFRQIVRPGELLDGIALAAWAGRASVTLGAIADEFVDPPGPGAPCPVCGSESVLCGHSEAQRIAEVFADGNAELDRAEDEDRRNG